MIGRNQDVLGFDLIRWARRCAHGEFEVSDGTRRRLTSREAHLLVVLATYADRSCKCFPSIKTLADDMVLKATLVSGQRKTSAGKTRAVAYYRCTPVSNALSGLQELGLVWSESGGRGRKAVRELLYDEDRLADALRAAGRPLSSSEEEDKGETTDGSSLDPSSFEREDKSALSSSLEVLSSLREEGNCHRTPRLQLPNPEEERPSMSSSDEEDNPAPSTGRTSSPFDGCVTDQVDDVSAESVRNAIVRSLGEARALPHALAREGVA